MRKSSARAVLALLLAALLMGASLGSALAASSYDMPYYIEVDIANQIVTVYNTSDGTIVRQMLTSSGMNNSTPLGTFYLMENGRASEREEWTWFQQYHCFVKFATRIYKGYMFHSLPFAKKDESTMLADAVEEFGTPTSHGCMRLRVDDARFIAKQCLVGTRVRIFDDAEPQEELRQLLLVSSYTGENGMSYSEYLGYSEDALSRGNAGVQVSDLQYRLADLGYFEGEPDGHYNTETTAAVKRFQQDLGVSQNGIASGELLEVLYSDDAPVSTGLIALEEGRSGPVVKKLQQALAELGLYSGSLDSVYDVEVSDAVKLFQEACGYVADGRASAKIQRAVYHQLTQMRDSVGDAPQVEIVREEIQMAQLHSENSNIIVRQQPDTGSQSVGKLRDGDTMRVLGVSGDWVNVARDSASGYVLKKYLTPLTQYNVVLKYSGDGGQYQIGHTNAEYLAGAQSVADEFSQYYTSADFVSGSDAEIINYVTVNTGDDQVSLNLRAEPDSQGEVLAKVPNGTNLRVLTLAEGWTKVGYGEAIGYLLNDYLSFHEGSAADLSAGDAADGSDADDMADETIGEAIVATVLANADGSDAMVYDDGSDDANQLGTLGAGIQVDVVEIIEGDNWVRISYQGQQGYMKDVNLQFELM